MIVNELINKLKSLPDSYKDNIVLLYNELPPIPTKIKAVSSIEIQLLPNYVIIKLI